MIFRAAAAFAAAFFLSGPAAAVTQVQFELPVFLDFTGGAGVFLPDEPASVEIDLTFDETASPDSSTGGTAVYRTALSRFVFIVRDAARQRLGGFDLSSFGPNDAMIVGTSDLVDGPELDSFVSVSLSSGAGDGAFSGSSFQLDVAIVSVDDPFPDLSLANLTADLVSAKRGGSYLSPDLQIVVPAVAATHLTIGQAVIYGDPVAAIPTPAAGPLLIGALVLLRVRRRLGGRRGAGHAA